MALLFADEATTWTAAIGGTITSAGFAGVVAWYLLTKAIPRMQDKFDASLVAQQTLFEKALDKVMDRHDKLNAERDAREIGESKAIVDALQEQGVILEEQGKALSALTAALQKRRPQLRPPQQPPEGGHAP